MQCNGMFKCFRLAAALELAFDERITTSSGTYPFDKRGHIPIPYSGAGAVHGGHQEIRFARSFYGRVRRFCAQRPPKSGRYAELAICCRRRRRQ